MNFFLKRLSRLTSRPEQTQIALGVVAIMALIFGFWQLKTSLRLPVGLGNSQENVSTSPIASISGDILQLQQQDSDGDGLSDYEELYIYNTSPYLVDSDSDGYSDKTEVDSGNDPNCAPGITCGPTIIASAPDTTTENDAPTADQIRAMLRQAGASEDQIARYDDATLLQIYKEVAGEVAPTSGSNNVTGGLNLTSEQKALIKSMSATELRQFLINGGAEAELLEKIDDVTLKAVVYQELGI